MATPNSTAITKQRAIQLIQAQQLTEARQILESANHLGDAELSGLLGMVYGMTGDYPAAELALEHAITLHPSNAMLRNNFGCVLRSLNKHIRAEEQFREALRIKPGYTGAEVNLGCALIDSGNFSEAEQVLRNALSTSSDHPEANNNLGTALRQMGRATEATAYFEKAARLQPNYPDALANLGMSRLFDNRLDEAEKILNRALSLAPHHISALYYLGFLLYKRKALEQAEQCFRRIIEIDPKHTNAAYFLSVIGVSEAPPQSPSEYVQELFDGYAEKFNDHLVGTLKYSAPGIINRLVRSALGNNPHALDIFDLGCGTGLCAQHFTDIAKSLTGVDLSERMLEKARALNIYNHLVLNDAISFLDSHENDCDLIIAGDVFVYIGDLASTFIACERTLRDGGLMSFSIETSNDERPYSLRPSGRYAQNPNYIVKLAQTSGFDVVATEDIILREEFDDSIGGQIYVLSKSQRS